MNVVLPVMAFETLSKVEEANLFTVINREQRAVAKRLLDELDGELKWDAPEARDAMAAICSRAIDMLAQEVAGPFEDRLLPSGMKGAKHQSLTLPQIRQAIMDSGLIGRVSGRDGKFIPGTISGKTNEDTLHNLVSVLSAYFTGLRDRNPERWNDGRQGLLCHNFGVMAHVRLLGELIPFVAAREGFDPHESSPDELVDAVRGDMEPLLSFVAHASAEEFKARFSVPFGGGGAPQYFYRAVDLIHEKNAGFSPRGFDDYRKSTSEDRAENADRQVKWIVSTVHDLVIQTLKKVYGDEFFDAGIKNKEIRLSAHKKRTDDDDAKPVETYLDFIELKRIVETSENWPHFKDTLNIPIDGQQKGLAKYVAWFEEINKIRRVPAHPFGGDVHLDKAA
jgi:hypothetical protein